ncbi:hypothetical protein Pcinc_005929 [Petrolisthes cinctipes]|uniref:Uncharacterized protein n=1 Tax=Petrolisthes cinctipes TaxID=88211 RepID=A0AAE1KZM9_PETCI|nr:hypothetical protein Pcinc_005929 [Petrolisthes cinctipes]
MLPWVQFAIAVGSGIRGESTVKVTGEVMVSGQQRVMVDTLLVSGHEDQCDVTVTLDAYWLDPPPSGQDPPPSGQDPPPSDQDPPPSGQDPPPSDQDPPPSGHTKE